MFKHAPMFKRVKAQAKQKITQQMREKYKKARDQIINAKDPQKKLLGAVWYLNAKHYYIVNTLDS